MLLRALLTAALLIPVNAFAQDPITQTVTQAAVTQAVTQVSEAWYKVAVGIIAIPLTMLAVLISWNMMKKTRMEMQKPQLEITEKQKEILSQTSRVQQLELFAEPLGQSQRALLILVRYVLLDVTLRI